MKKIFAAALVLLVVPFSSSAWDKLGHDVSAMIAWENMTSKAKKNISKYLEGHDDIVYYASWMDYMGYVTKSGYSNEWFDHCVPVNKDFEYAEGDFPGDALMAIEKAIERLGDGKYRNLDEINGRKELFHSVWDNMPSYGPHAWSVSEWCRYLGHCTKEERAEMVEGTPREWVADNARNCIVAYDIVRPDENVSDPDRYRGNLLAEQQLQKGGFRLAHVLNSIFGR